MYYVRAYVCSIATEDDDDDDDDDSKEEERRKPGIKLKKSYTECKENKISFTQFV